MNKRLQATPCTFFSTDEKAALHDAGTERLQVFLQAHFAILTIVVSLTLSPELSLASRVALLSPSRFMALSTLAVFIRKELYWCKSHLSSKIKQLLSHALSFTDHPAVTRAFSNNKEKNTMLTVKCNWIHLSHSLLLNSSFCGRLLLEIFLSGASYHIPEDAEISSHRLITHPHVYHTAMSVLKALAHWN